MTQNKALIVIPARMASTRYPNKPMAEIHGQTMIERVWRIAKASQCADNVVIATDDEGLKEFATNFGATVVMTSSECRTGTDRAAEVIAQFENQYEIIFNLQGDALLTPPWVIDEVLRVMQNNLDIVMGTPAVKLSGDALKDFVAIKKTGSSRGTCVVFDKDYNALYFSNALIPAGRSDDTEGMIVYRHIGLYAYRADTLLKLTQLPSGVLEDIEKLEQLRALENGIGIRVVPVDYHGRTHGSVDTPEDVALVESIITREGELIA